MEVEAFFNSEIKNKVLSELLNAHRSIYAAIAFFTDTEILEVLKDKIEAGLIVHLVVDEDYFKEKELIDIFSKKRKSYPKGFLEILGEVADGIESRITQNENALIYYYKPFESNKGMMHHKFCIIDTEILITGSFNWTFNAANNNKENIVVIKNNSKLVKEFNKEFENLQNQSLLLRLSEGSYQIKCLTGNNETIYNSSNLYVWEKGDYIEVEKFVTELIGSIDFNQFEELVLCNFNKYKLAALPVKVSSKILKYDSKSIDDLGVFLKKKFYRQKKRIYLINLYEILRSTFYLKIDDEEVDIYKEFKKIIYELRKYSRILNAIFFVVNYSEPGDRIELNDFKYKEEIFEEISDFFYGKDVDEK